MTGSKLLDPKFMHLKKEKRQGTVKNLEIATSFKSSEQYGLTGSNLVRKGEETFWQCPVESKLGVLSWVSVLEGGGGGDHTVNKKQTDIR